jgi:hypothetical protein
MKVKKIIFFLVVVLLLQSSLTALAAGRFDHEIVGSFNMHRSSIAPVAAGDNRWGMGFGGGGGYACHFSSHLSFRTGLHLNYYQSTTGMTDFLDTYETTFPSEWWELLPNLVDVDPNKLTFTSTMNEYVAQQSALSVQIPLLVQYENLFRFVRHLGWYVAGGAKLGYAITGHSDADIYGLTTEARPTYQNTVLGGPEESGGIVQLGFGKLGDEKVSAKFALGFQAIGYLELGFTQELTDKYTLYAGVFGEYCLYSMVSSAPAPAMLEYKMLPEVLEEQPEVLVDKVKAYRFLYNPSANVTGASVEPNYLLSFGITVRIGFTFSKRVRQRNDRLFNILYFSDNQSFNVRYLR